MSDLDGGGKKHDVKFAAGDGVSGLAKRFDVFRQRPLINGNGGDVGAALVKAGEKFRRGDAVFLHGDLQIFDRMGCSDFVVEDAEDFAPGIRFRRDKRGADAEFAEGGNGLGPACHHYHTLECFRELFARVSTFDGGDNGAGARSALAKASASDESMETSRIAGATVGRPP